MDIESFETHIIVFVNRAHFSDWHEDFLDVPIRAYICFRQHHENLLYCVQMAYLCQSGVRETFFANCHNTHSLWCGGVKLLK